MQAKVKNANSTLLSIFVVICGLFAVLTLSTSCTPKYPKCGKDAHCRTGEVCFQGTCQQCRTKNDCQNGEWCNSGRCEGILGFCNSYSDCAGKACRNNRCVSCQSAAECGPGGRCENGTCFSPGQCNSNDDCPETYECQNGSCVAPPADTSNFQAGCSITDIYFGYDQYFVSADQGVQLKKVAECIKHNSGKRLRIEGHCDPRGTEGYNLALGDKRSQAVYNYLLRLGVSSGQIRSVSKGEVEASGFNDSSYSKDRRAHFVWE